MNVYRRGSTNMDGGGGYYANEHPPPPGGPPKQQQQHHHHHQQQHRRGGPVSGEVGYGNPPPPADYRGSRGGAGGGDGGRRYPTEMGSAPGVAPSVPTNEGYNKAKFEPVRRNPSNDSGGNPGDDSQANLFYLQQKAYLLKKKQMKEEGKHQQVVATPYLPSSRQPKSSRAVLVEDDDDDNATQMSATASVVSTRSNTSLQPSNNNNPMMSRSSLTLGLANRRNGPVPYENEIEDDDDLQTPRSVMRSSSGRNQALYAVASPTPSTGSNHAKPPLAFYPAQGRPPNLPLPRGPGGGPPPPPSQRDPRMPRGGGHAPPNDYDEASEYENYQRIRRQLQATPDETGRINGNNTYRPNHHNHNLQPDPNSPVAPNRHHHHSDRNDPNVSPMPNQQHSAFASRAQAPYNEPGPQPNHHHNHPHHQHHHHHQPTNNPSFQQQQQQSYEGNRTRPPSSHDQQGWASSAASVSSGRSYLSESDNNSVITGTQSFDNASVISNDIYNDKGSGQGTQIPADNSNSDPEYERYERRGSPPPPQRSNSSGSNEQNSSEIDDADNERYNDESNDNNVNIIEQEDQDEYDNNVDDQDVDDPDREQYASDPRPRMHSNNNEDASMIEEEQEEDQTGDEEEEQTERHGFSRNHFRNRSTNHHCRMLLRIHSQSSSETEEENEEEEMYQKRLRDVTIFENDSTVVDILNLIPVNEQSNYNQWVLDQVAASKKAEEEEIESLNKRPRTSNDNEEGNNDANKEDQEKEKENKTPEKSLYPSKRQVEQAVAPIEVDMVFAKAQRGRGAVQVGGGGVTRPGVVQSYNNNLLNKESGSGTGSSTMSSAALIDAKIRRNNDEMAASRHRTASATTATTTNPTPGGTRPGVVAEKAGSTASAILAAKIAQSEAVLSSRRDSMNGVPNQGRTNRPMIPDDCQTVGTHTSGSSGGAGNVDIPQGSFRGDTRVFGPHEQIHGQPPNRSILGPGRNGGIGKKQVSFRDRISNHSDTTEGSGRMNGNPRDNITGPPPPPPPNMSQRGGSSRQQDFQQGRRNEGSFDDNSSVTNNHSIMNQRDGNVRTNSQRSMSGRRENSNRSSLDDGSNHRANGLDGSSWHSRQSYEGDGRYSRRASNENGSDHRRSMYDVNPPMTGRPIMERNGYQGRDGSNRSLSRNSSGDRYARNDVALDVTRAYRYGNEEEYGYRNQPYQQPPNARYNNSPNNRDPRGPPPNDPNNRMYGSYGNDRPGYNGGDPRRGYNNAGPRDMSLGVHPNGGGSLLGPMRRGINDDYSVNGGGYSDRYGDNMSMDGRGGQPSRDPLNNADRTRYVPPNAPYYNNGRNDPGRRQSAYQNPPPISPMTPNPPPPPDISRQAAFRSGPPPPVLQSSNSSRSLNTGNAGPQIEISPGVFERLRGAKETLQAVDQRNIAYPSCMVCSAQLICIADAQYVLCPSCKVVSPVFDSRGRPGPEGGGVGLGLLATDYPAHSALRNNNNDNFDHQRYYGRR